MIPVPSFSGIWLAEQFIPRGMNCSAAVEVRLHSVRSAGSSHASPPNREKDKVSGGLSWLLLRPPTALRSAKSYDFEKAAGALLKQLTTTALPAAFTIFLFALKEKSVR